MFQIEVGFVDEVVEIHTVELPLEAGVGAGQRADHAVSIKLKQFGRHRPKVMPGDADPPLVRNQHGGKEGGIRRPFLFRVGCEILLYQFVQVANAWCVDFPCRIRHDGFD